MKLRRDNDDWDKGRIGGERAEEDLIEAHYMRI